MAISRNFAQINRQTNEVVLIGDSTLGMPLPDDECIYTIDIRSHAQGDEIAVGWVYEADEDVFTEPCIATRADPVQETVATAATMADGSIELTLPAQVSTGTLVKFSAPCACESVTGGIVIDGVTYSMVDAAGNMVDEIGGMWTAGALVAVLIDTANKKAYIQNAAFNAALPKSGGTMTGPITLGGDIILVEGVNYGTTLPEPGIKGRLFFKVVE